MNPMIIAMLSILLSVAAQFVLKSGMSTPRVIAAMEDPWRIDAMFVFLTEPKLVAGFSLYGVGALIWLAVLARWDVSKAYPLVGVGFVLTAVIGYFAGEQISSGRVVGVLLISFGVLVISRT